MAEAWDPAQYDRFKDERTRPFYDLAALVQPAGAMRVLDLGCGTGDRTAWLHAHLGAARTLGVDSSESMLAEAARYAGQGLSFQHGDLATWTEGAPFDLVFSNAAVHWVDQHPHLFAHLAGLLQPGGQLAIQMPANHQAPSSRVAQEVAREEPFQSALDGGMRPPSVLRPEQYAELLYRTGFVEQQVRLQVYAHLLGSREEVVEWVKGTTLTDVKRRLPEALYALFLERYRQRLFAELPDERPFFFPFQRILLWARR